MVATILVPLDGSVLAEKALPYAERLSTDTGSRLVLSRVLPLLNMQAPESDLASADEARVYLRGIAERLSAGGRQVDTDTPWGAPVGSILDQIRLHQAQVVVMATHGRSGPGRWLYGSVADDVLRHASVPVVLVSPLSANWSPDRPLSILVPLDGSHLAEAALGPAEQLARQLGSGLVLLQVVPFPSYAVYGDEAYVAAFDPEAAIAEAQEYLKSIASRLRPFITDVRVRIDLGQPPVAIAEVAAQEHASLIAMATHGRSGLARLVLGSVATGTLRRASVPLLLVRPTALEMAGVADRGAVAAG
ncbi:MAG TPA: universal stress protein [Chloroflexota bacterium]